MSSTNDLHVIFGTGPVGLAVMDELVSQGKRVRMVNRSGLKTAPAGVESLSGDVTNLDFARQAASGATVVYFALNAPYTDWVRQFPPLQKGVLAGAMAAKAKLVVMENLYGYGKTDGKPMTEDLPLNADYDKGQTRVAMSRELMAAHQAGNVRVAIARASDFYGPRVKESSMGERVFPPAIQGGTIQLVGKLDQPHSYTYMPDVGKTLAILGERAEADGQVWHVPSDRPVTAQQFIDLILKETGQKPKLQVAGKTLMTLLGLFMPMMRELKKTLYQFDAPFIIDSRKFERAFGLKATSLEDGIRATIAWQREQLRARS
jgi:nucleoside-diphosphate-sugar epimerase